MKQHETNYTTTRAAWVFVLLLAGAASVHAQESPEPPPGERVSAAESHRILEGLDRLVRFPHQDFAAEYTLTQDRPGQGTSVTRMAVFRRDRTDTYTILIMDPPAERGKGYLRIGETLWLYDPVAARFTATSARERFQNSNARHADFAGSRLAEDYRIITRERGTLGAYTTDIYHLEAVTDTVPFPRRTIWVDEDQLLRMSHDYSLSGQHMRTTAIPTYRKLGDRYVPVRIVIQDELRGRTIQGEFRRERTLIAIDKPTLAPVPDIVFTRAYLERFSD